MDQSNKTRREFLKTGAAAGAMALGSYRASARTSIPPNSKMNIGGIGVGGIGLDNLQNCSGENIVALCDVDHEYAGPVFDQYPNARRYVDYREMLDKEKDLDGVIIATPDHTHAVITIAALRAGLNVYCQKPLTHDFHELREVLKVSREANVTTQMGIQGHSGEGLRLICEWIWDGAIGTVQRVDAWCSLSPYPFGQMPYGPKFSGRPPDTPPVPATLNWDLWLGPAPFRPYHSTYHPLAWRCWWDFGSGAMDRGVHTFDSIYTALKLGHPESVVASVLGGNKETYPVAAVLTYQFAAREGFPPLELNWYEGVEAPRPKELEDNRAMPEGGGVFFRGDKGVLMADFYGEGARLIPESAMQAYKRPPHSLPRLNCTHEQEWIDSCKDKRKAGADFEYGALITEIALLGNIAKQLPGKVLKWDEANMMVTNVEEQVIKPYLERPYRDGWTL